MPPDQPSAARDRDDLLSALVDFRRDIHAHPELGFEEHRTARAIAAFLRSLDIEVHEGVGGTGVVGVIRGGSSSRAIGLRADMDALPMEERTGLPYASRHAGAFHGCGHDGHVAMLLGAAHRLAGARDFDGIVNLIFQPAEEGLGGARVMVEDGLFDRFACDRIFALHNWPELPAGTIATRTGPIMAAADRFEILLTGKGGHAAIPHMTPDAILAASALVEQLNSIVSRHIPASAQAVVSVTQIHGGDAHNVIPEQVRLVGTVRSFDPAVQKGIEQLMRRMAQGVALSFGLTAEVDYQRQYPATINHDVAVEEAMAAAALVGRAEIAPEPAFTSEDFAFMLERCPGAYIWLGQNQGPDSPSLHSPRYDFNDDVMATGIALHVALARGWLGAG